MRLRDYAENIPKPMVPIGYRPVIWHLMRYYAHFGHTDFVLCLGYRGDLIKEYFLNYEECVSNDFVLSDGGRHRVLINSDIEDWRITFVDTGLNANIGERLKAVERHLAGETMFLANYADGLSDVPIDRMVADFEAKRVVASFAGVNGWHSFHTVDANADGLATRIDGMSTKELRDTIASFLCVKPNLSYHFVASQHGVVTAFRDIAHSGLRVNGGFFAFKTEIFDYLRAGEELVLEPFQRLLEARQLVAYEYDGFWLPMDTAKDKKRLDDLYESGIPPWQLWKQPRAVPDVMGDPLLITDSVVPAAPLVISA